MAVSRAVEARKRAKKLREASLAKSKVKASKVKKKIGKGLKSFGKRLGIGQDKEAWAKGAPERKAKRKASQEKAAEKRAENKAKAKKGPVYSAKKQQAGGYKPLPPKSKKAAPQPFGKAFSSARKAGKKTFTWKGKSYTTKTADDVKKAKAAKKAAPKKDIGQTDEAIGQSYEQETAEVSKPAGPESPVGKKEYEAKPGQKSTMQRNKPKYSEGGKVEASNPYGWPTRDARNGGQK